MKFKIEQRVGTLTGCDIFNVYVEKNDSWWFLTSLSSMEEVREYCENMAKPRVINTTFLEI